MNVWGMRISAFPIKCILVEDLEFSLQLERKTDSFRIRYFQTSMSQSLLWFSGSRY